ncbi:MAG: hypothetical protein HUJ98_09190, partial [Bacteroidaceae bacterium]|nr:hypothetical protein [Bacteroidaceae bacterium]
PQPQPRVVVKPSGGQKTSLDNKPTSTFEGMLKSRADKAIAERDRFKKFYLIPAKDKVDEARKEFNKAKERHDYLTSTDQYKFITSIKGNKPEDIKMRQDEMRDYWLMVSNDDVGKQFHFNRKPFQDKIDLASKEYEEVYKRYIELRKAAYNAEMNVRSFGVFGEKNYKSLPDTYNTAIEDYYKGVLKNISLENYFESADYIAKINNLYYATPDKIIDSYFKLREATKERAKDYERGRADFIKKYDETFGKVDIGDYLSKKVYGAVFNEAQRTRTQYVPLGGWDTAKQLVGDLSSPDPKKNGDTLASKLDKIKEQFEKEKNKEYYFRSARLIAPFMKEFDKVRVNVPEELRGLARCADAFPRDYLNVPWEEYNAQVFKNCYNAFLNGESPTTAISRRIFGDTYENAYKKYHDRIAPYKPAVGWDVAKDMVGDINQPYTYDQGNTFRNKIKGVTDPLERAKVLNLNQYRYGLVTLGLGNLINAAEEYIRVDKNRNTAETESDFMKKLTAAEKESLKKYTASVDDLQKEFSDIIIKKNGSLTSEPDAIFKDITNANREFFKQEVALKNKLGVTKSGFNLPTRILQEIEDTGGKIVETAKGLNMLKNHEYLRSWAETATHLGLGVVIPSLVATGGGISNLFARDSSIDELQKFYVNYDPDKKDMPNRDYHIAGKVHGVWWNKLDPKAATREDYAKALNIYFKLFPTETGCCSNFFGLFGLGARRSEDFSRDPRGGRPDGGGGFGGFGGYGSGGTGGNTSRSLEDSDEFNINNETADEAIAKRFGRDKRGRGQKLGDSLNNLSHLNESMMADRSYPSLSVINENQQEDSMIADRENLSKIDTGSEKPKSTAAVDKQENSFFAMKFDAKKVEKLLKFKPTVGLFSILFDNLKDVH